MSAVRRLARPMLATVFVAGGLNQLRFPAKHVRLGRTVIDKLAALSGLPADPEALVRLNGAAMLTAGSALAAGRMPRAASAVLAASMVPVTYAGHPFWTEQDPARRADQVNHFLKNVALIGGVLLAATDPEL